ncbi:MAG: hypothetical protein Q9220_001825 [cf. Caloplaca sp. 1 TL-2023]
MLHRTTINPGLLCSVLLDRTMQSAKQAWEIEYPPNPSLLIDGSNPKIHATADTAVENVLQQWTHERWTDDVVAKSDGPLVEIDEAVVEGDEAAVESGEIMVKIDEAVVEGDEAVVEGDEAAVESAEAAAKREDAAVESAKAAAERQEAAVESAKAAAEREEAAMESAKAAVENSRKEYIENYTDDYKREIRRRFKAAVLGRYGTAKQGAAVSAA